jgi:hypothetical protein
MRGASLGETSIGRRGNQSIDSVLGYLCAGNPSRRPDRISRKRLDNHGYRTPMQSVLLNKHLSSKKSREPTPGNNPVQPSNVKPQTMHLLYVQAGQTVSQARQLKPRLSTLCQMTCRRTMSPPRPYSDARQSPLHQPVLCSMEANRVVS